MIWIKRCEYGKVYCEKNRSCNCHNLGGCYHHVFSDEHGSGRTFPFGKAISPQATAALEAKYGLDKPLFQRYLTYIGDALHGDFGDSLKQRGRTVMDIIKMKFPVSARVGGLTVLVALTIGIPLGCIAALKRGKFLDSLISVVATCGIAVPSFVICTLLLYFFGVKLMLLPTVRTQL